MVPYLALAVWPIVSTVFFRLWRLDVALVVTVVGGYLFLAPGFALDLPLLPAISDTTLPVLVALLLATIWANRARNSRLLPDVETATGSIFPKSKIARVLLIMLLISPFATTVLNQNAIVFASGIIVPSLTPVDAVSGFLRNLVMIVPLLLAQKYLGTGEGQRTLLFAIAGLGLFYSLPTLFEVRMSPQLNNMFYGYFPHDFGQHIRGNGFRPLVFLPHGLVLGLFIGTASLATLGAFRSTKTKNRGLWIFATVWLVFTLVLAKTLGAFLIFLVLAPVILFLKVRWQIWVAAGIAALTILYPAVRGAGYAPVSAAVSSISSISDSRLQSFNFRVFHEEQLLERASEKPVFGWGDWGRWRVRNSDGYDISVSDGLWVITIGTNGWFGYVALFGLLGAPIILIALRYRKVQPGPETAAISLLLAAGLVDLIPNAGLTPMTWLLAGSLWGRLAWKPSHETDDPLLENPEPQRGPRYRRSHKELGFDGPILNHRTLGHTSAK